MECGQRRYSHGSAVCGNCGIGRDAWFCSRPRPPKDCIPARTGGRVMTAQADPDGTPLNITSKQVLMPRKRNHFGMFITQSTHSSVGIRSRSDTGSGFFGISPRLRLRICRHVQSGNCRESADRRVKQSFTARAKLMRQLLRKVTQLSIIVSD